MLQPVFLRSYRGDIMNICLRILYQTLAQVSCVTSAGHWHASSCKFYQVQYKLGICESAVWVRIESGGTLRIRIKASQVPSMNT